MRKIPVIVDMAVAAASQLPAAPREKPETKATEQIPFSCKRLHEDEYGNSRQTTSFCRLSPRVLLAGEVPPSSFRATAPVLCGPLPK